MALKNGQLHISVSKVKTASGKCWLKNLILIFLTLVKLYFFSCISEIISNFLKEATKKNKNFV